MWSLTQKTSDPEAVSFLKSESRKEPGVPWRGKQKPSSWASRQTVLGGQGQLPRAHVLLGATVPWAGGHKTQIPVLPKLLASRGLPPYTHRSQYHGEKKKSCMCKVYWQGDRRHHSDLFPESRSQGRILQGFSNRLSWIMDPLLLKVFWC